MCSLDGPRQLLSPGLVAALGRLPDVVNDRAAVAAAGEEAVDVNVVAAECAAGAAAFGLGAVDIRPEKRARRELGAYCGQLYRGSAHSHYLHACKAAKKAKDKEQAVRVESKEIRKAWNSERVRKGDMADVEGDDERCHSNTFDSSTVMREGWKQIGR